MKKIFGCVAVVAAALSLGACSAADTASRNISYDSDNFKVMRRVVFVNGITDKYLLSIEGLCSITKDKEDLQLEVTCKTGEGEFKKHYLGISDNVTYFVEQMDASSVDTFHYKVAFRPETILPDIDMQTSGDEN
nr:MAG TPA: outer membrane protein assembly factor [Caudoviricetes sp.]